MADALDPGIFKEALIILGAAAIVIPVFHRLRVSPLLGFILIGMLVGPFGLGTLTQTLPWLEYITIQDRDSMALMAEFGVVVLLFMIGLEMSLGRMMRLRKLVFGFGSLQFLLCSAALAAAAWGLGQGYAAAVVIGLALGLSSTAIITQLLSEEKRINTSVGRASFAVLLLQDIAVVPVLFAVSMMGADRDQASVTGFALSVAKALLGVGALAIFGRFALRPLFRSVARTKSPELFLAACLLVIMAASLASAAAGVSMALGALIAGLLLAETEYRRQIEILVEPFKGLLLGVFLISVGMSVDLEQLAGNPVVIGGLIAGILLIKTAIVFALSPFFALNRKTALNTAMLLAPAGEFTFVIVAVARGSGILERDIADLILILAALTMTMLPLFSKLATRASARIAQNQPAHPLTEEKIPEDLKPQVVIAGFGRVGQTVAALLEAHKIPYLGLDMNVDRISLQRARGRPVYYGDMTRVGLLENLGLGDAIALVVTLDQPAVVDGLVTAARAAYPELTLVARARDARHAAHLYNLGVTDAVPETVEASLQLAEAVLVDIGIPMGPVIASIHEQRAQFRADIQAQVPDQKLRVVTRKLLRTAGPPRPAPDGGAVDPSAVPR
jgi:monovalent cation:H+ antiporter-2, CPA2 family